MMNDKSIMNKITRSWLESYLWGAAQNVAVQVDLADAMTDASVGLEHLDRDANT